LSPEPKIKAVSVSFYYGPKKVLNNINLEIWGKSVTAIIGPSGCGKSTFIRLLNRMNDLVPHSKLEGNIFLEGKDINAAGTDVSEIRRKVGMVFQKPNPFPRSIIHNLSYGLEIRGIRDKEYIYRQIETALKKAALWEEVKNRLHENALHLSGGQQQRLCIARCLVVEPEVILFDEPCASLDPISTQRIEELITELKKDYTIVIVTHNMQQAARVSDYTAFFYLGELIEYGKTERIFTAPVDKRTEDYLSGKFG